MAQVFPKHKRTVTQSDMATSNGKQSDMSQGNDSIFKEDYVHVLATSPVDTLEKNSELAFLNISDQGGLNKERGSVNVPEFAAIQQSGDSATLPLHNSFDLLHEKSALPSGEAMLAYKDTYHLSIDDLSESVEIVDKVSKKIVSLNQMAHSKVSGIVEIDSSETAHLNTNKTMLEPDIGIMTFPTSIPTSIEQCSKSVKN